MLKAFHGLRQIHKMFGEAESALVESIGRPICLPKCGRCCMVNTPTMSSIEAIHAASVLTGTGRLRGVLAIAEGWLVERDGNLTLFEGRPLGWMKPKLIEEWQKVTFSQCPFLSAERGCHIYDVRPLTCRSWGVTRHTGGVCPRPLGRGETAVQQMVVDGLDTIKPAVDKWKQDCRTRKPEWMVYASAPSVIMFAADPSKFKELVADNKVPSAKLVGMDIDTSLLWQPQMDAMLRGESPEIVLSMT